MDIENNKKNRNGFKGVFVVIMLAAAVLLGYSAGIMTERADTQNGVLQSRKFERINKLIEDNYYFSDKIDYDTAKENAYGAYVASFSDPFTYYISPEDYGEFTESIVGNYVGIGVQVTVSEDDFITVTDVFKGGAAQEAGIEPGDRIIAVDGETYTGSQLDSAVNVMKGHEGQTVKITIDDVSEGKEKELTVLRRHVNVETVSSEMMGDVGYLEISSFGNTTAGEFENHMEKLENSGAKNLIIDLRNNPGGTLDSVVAVADRLMPEGEIVRIKYKNQNDDVYKSDANGFSGKIVVLANENTASAAELLTGALRDVNKAEIVGKKTFGKGVVGTVFPIDSQSATVITTAEYFLPNGDNIHAKGIMPTIEVDLPENVKNIYLMNKSEDTQLKRALEEFTK